MFVHEAEVVVFHLFANKMPAHILRRLRFDVEARMTALEHCWYPFRRANTNIGHTNYALMYLTSFLLGTEALGNRASEEKAYGAFHDFCDYTLENGITEYNATTYYKIDLRCWSHLAKYSRNAEVRRRADAQLDFDVELAKKQGTLEGRSTVEFPLPRRQFER